MEELAFGVSQGEFGQARGQCAEEWVKQRVVWATGYSLGGGAAEATEEGLSSWDQMLAGRTVRAV